MAVVYCVRISYTSIHLVAFVSRASVRLCRSCPDCIPFSSSAMQSAYRYTHSTNHMPPCPAMLCYRHALPCCCIPLPIGIYRASSHAPLHMPLKRSYFVSNGLLLLGYKYPALVVKMRYSLILAVSRLSDGIRLFGCCNRGVVYRVLHGVGWGIYDILRGAGYSPHHTPHIKRGEIRRLACVRPLLARLS